MTNEPSYRAVRMLEEHQHREARFVVLELSCSHNRILGAKDIGNNEWISTDLDEELPSNFWRRMRNKESVSVFCHHRHEAFIERMTIYSNSGSPWRITKDGIRGYEEPMEQEHFEVGYI